MKGETRVIRAEVNGQTREFEVEVRQSLADALRQELRLTGTHLACEHGVCGACTVIVDDQAVRSCLMLAVQINGGRVETVESLGSSEALGQLQESFHEQHGLQCGFCTPGILMSAEAARRENESLDEVIDDVLGGHLCRCTGYQNIRSAIEDYWSKGVGR